MSGTTRKDESGCLFVFAVVAAELVFAGWFLGQFLLDPGRCGGPGCEALRAALTLSVASAILGIGCVVLLACNNAFDTQISPTLLLGATTGAFAIAAVAGVKAGLIILPLFDIILMLVPTGLLLSNELTRSGAEPQETRRVYVTSALVGLPLAFAFAVVVSLIVLK